MKPNLFKNGMRFLILILITVVVIYYKPLPSEEFRFDNRLEPGEYIVYQEEHIPSGEITSMIVDDGFIFLFYDPYGVVNVYSTDGIFQYGIQVYTIADGYGDFAYIDSNLYIFARGNQVYKFEKTEFLTVVDAAQELERFRRYERLYLSVEKSTMYNGEQYYLLKDVNKVTKKSIAGEFITVIDLEQPFQIGW